MCVCKSRKREVKIILMIFNTVWTTKSNWRRWRRRKRRPPLSVSVWMCTRVIVCLHSDNIVLNNDYAKCNLIQITRIFILFSTINAFCMLLFHCASCVLDLWWALATAVLVKGHVRAGDLSISPHICRCVPHCHFVSALSKSFVFLLLIFTIHRSVTLSAAIKTSTSIFTLTHAISSHVWLCNDTRWAHLHAEFTYFYGFIFDIWSKLGTNSISNTTKKRRKT